MPGLFIVLWSTGFIGARLGLPYAEPFTFLSLRLALASALLLVVALIMRAPWPKTPRAVAHIAVAGFMVHGVYLGGVFWGIGHGLSAGVAAIIVCVQPLLTAALAGVFLGERIIARHWLGLLLGLGGVAVVVSSRLQGGTASAVSVAGALAALLGITLGTMYQKRFCAEADLRTGGTIQYAVSGAVLFVLALSLEQMTIEWTKEFVFALVWLVVVLSTGAIGLLFALIRHGAVAKVASLFYLAPPFTVIFGYLLFDEALETSALIGLAIVVAGVALVNLKPKQGSAPMEN